MSNEPENEKTGERENGIRRQWNCRSDTNDKFSVMNDEWSDLHSSVSNHHAEFTTSHHASLVVNSVLTPYHLELRIYHSASSAAPRLPSIFTSSRFPVFSFSGSPRLTFGCDVLPALGSSRLSRSTGFVNRVHQLRLDNAVERTRSRFGTT